MKTKFLILLCSLFFAHHLISMQPEDHFIIQRFLKKDSEESLSAFVEVKNISETADYIILLTLLVDPALYSGHPMIQKIYKRYIDGKSTKYTFFNGENISARDCYAVSIFTHEEFIKMKKEKYD